MDRKQPILKRIALAFFIILCSSWAWALNGENPITGKPAKPVAVVYCTPFFDEEGLLTISQFNMGSIAKSSNSGSGYEDFTTSQTNIQKGNIISFSVTISDQWTIGNTQVRIWIDYNQDSDFRDTNEMVYTSALAEFSNPSTINGSFTVNNTATNGSTRLRILLYDKYENPAPNSCDIIVVGQAEDYTVNIVSPPSITPSVSSLSAFTYVQDSGPSAEQSFSVSGTALSSNISVTAPTNWEVSTTSGSGFAGTATLTSSGGTVYTRLKSGLTAASYSGNISLTSGSVTSTSVALSGTVTSPPSITPSVSSLSAFSYVQDSGPSAEQSFAVTGSALSSDISIEAPTNWEVSTTSGSGFASTATLTSSGGTVYTRLKSGLTAASYSGNISLTSGSVTSTSVALSGTVTSPPSITPSVSSLSAFSYVQDSGPSAEQSFAVTGSALSSDISIEAPTNWEVSTTSGSGFAGTATLTSSGGTVYTRLKSGLTAASYTGNISLTSGSATTTVSLSGSVEPSPPFLVISGTSDMGTTCYSDGTELQQTYTITNTGGTTATLVDYDVDFFQGFSILESPSTTIASGGTTTITISFNPSTPAVNPGNNTENLEIYYDNNAIATFEISATVNFPEAPTIETDAATQVTSQSAQFNGNLTDLGSCEGLAVEKGFVYATSPNPTISNYSEIAGFADLTTGTYSSTLTGLTSGTTYYYRAYAKFANDNYVYGEDQSFTTLAVPTWNGTAWNITPDATQPAIINGDYSGPAFESLSLMVNEGKTLTVNSYVKTGNVTNNGNIIVANNSNFVQTGTFTAGDNSSFKVRRDSKDVVRQAYINWSSPMKGSTQTLKAFSYGKLADGVTNQSTTGTVDNRFYTYSNNNYVQIIDPSRTTFSTLGAGYLIRTPNDFLTPQAFHGQFEGQVPNSGSIRVEHGTIPGNFILLGNPYPSAISLDDFFDLNFYTTYTAYIWQSSAIVDSNGNYSGTNYATYSSAGSVPAGAINGYIPVGQAFFVERMIWVRSQDDTNGYYFTNAMRRTEETGTYSKGTTTDRFWLEMKTPSGAKPQLLLAFNTAASTGYDQGYDAKMIDNNADVLYTTVDDKKLVIDAHGAFNETDSFSLDANFAQAGTYTINILQKEGIFSGSQKIFLKDNVTGTLTDLSAGAYSFNADTGVQTNRFSIAFTTDRTLGTDGTTKNSLTIFSTGKQVHLKADGKISNVEVYNMSGQLIASDKTFAKEKTIAVPYTGVVLVKVQLENGTTSMKKLILQ